MEEVLLDSNIIIYSAASFKEEIEVYLYNKILSASIISYIEVLGYHKLTNQDKTFFQMFFDSVELIPITDRIVQKSIELRQVKNIKLGDAIIAATTLIHNKTLVSRNVKDFNDIEELKIYNPFSDN